MRVHVGGTGPQSQKTQAHARNNLSTLYVLRKPTLTRGKRVAPSLRDPERA